MKTPCKHPIKEIDLLEEYSSSPDGYGGDHEYYSYYLICKNAKLNIKYIVMAIAAEILLSR